MNIINNLQEHPSFSIEKFIKIKTISNGINSVTKLVSNVIDQIPLKKAVSLANEIPKQFTQLTKHFLDSYFPDPDLLEAVVSNPEIVETLIANGADVKIQDSDGATPLYRAVANQPSEIAEKLAKILIKNGAPLNLPDKFGQIPLHAAVYYHYNCPELIKMMVDKGSNINQLTTMTGASPSLLAKLFKIKLEGQQKENVSYNEEYRMRKLLANLWSLCGTTELLPGRKVELEGLLPYFGLNEIHRLLKIFQETTSVKDTKELKSAVDILGATTPPLFANPDEIAKRYKNGEALSFVTGCPGHAIHVIFFKKYMLICNRGDCRRKGSITAFVIDRSLPISETDLQQLRFGTGKYTLLSFFHADLPMHLGDAPALFTCLGYIPSDSITNIFSDYPQHDQQIGNCGMLSPKTSVLALLAIQKLTAIDPKLFTDDLFPEKALEIAYEQAFNEAYDTYQQYSEFCRIQTLKEYLQFKIEEKKNSISDAISPDHSLVKSIIEKFHRKIGMYFVYADEIQGLLEQYQQVFPEYQEAFPLPKSKKNSGHFPLDAID